MLSYFRDTALVWAAFKAWRRRRIIARHPLPQAAWQQALAALPFLAGLGDGELRRLRELAILFLQQKHLSTAGGLTLTDAMRVNISLQACLPILQLDLDYYRDWVEVIIYPGEFVGEHVYTDEHGIVHQTREPRSGESWLQGPLVLSWDAVAHGAADGINVVIHESAHKLDMLNGDANGYPPLHAGMSRQQWSEVFTAAYDDFCRRVDDAEDTWLDPYAAQSPAEFFAVASESFFETPHHLQHDYPAVYRQLKLFYRQDPVVRQ